MPWTEVEDRKLFHEEAGTGTPVVLLHGLGGDHRAFVVTLRRFAKRHRALAIDHRDSGRSSECPSLYATADMADDVAAVLSAAGVERAHIVGHSLGGLVAQEFALRHPGRVFSLFLASAHAGTDPWRQALIESWMLLRKRTSAAEFTRVTLPWLASRNFFRDAPSQVEGLIRFAERNDLAISASAFERLANAVLAHDTWSRLPEIGAPTHVLVGGDDIVNPPSVSQQLAEAIAGAGFEVLPGVGHLPHVEDSATFINSVTDFIERVEDNQ